MPDWLQNPVLFNSKSLKSWVLNLDRKESQNQQGNRTGVSVTTN